MIVTTSSQSVAEVMFRSVCGVPSLPSNLRSLGEVVTGLSNHSVQKRRKVQHSMISDSTLREYAALVVSERYVFEMDRKARTSTMDQQSCTAVMQSHRHDGR